ncbi:MAG: cytochrome-c peroxidase [Flavobacteriales bacterium]|nr:cytochrome-c peroxidase [Flavobacteriales bacterium]
MKKSLFILLVITVSFYSCSKTEEPIPTPEPTPQQPGQPTPAPLLIPQIFSQNILAPFIPSNNPQTIEGVALGRKLFFDPILSGDGTQACADCHSPEFSFTDSNQFSTGITMQQGNRNSMAVFNVAWNWNGKFFWDGRANSLEAQALGPVVNPIEMNNTWPNAVASLQADPNYPSLFNTAFGTSTIDSNLVAMAIAQFERTLISANSRFDQFLLGQIALTPQELNGFNLFMDENGGDCFHCHGGANNPLWTDNDFHNNGLDATFTDNGRGIVTGNPADNGKFKSPSLRNLAYTAPYMHDGRFATLDEVLDHYSIGLVNSPTIDPLMKFVGQGGVQLTPSEKADLKAFLLSLTDNDFITNPAFQDPNP